MCAPWPRLGRSLRARSARRSRSAATPANGARSAAARTSADDQREDDALSLTFETPPLAETFEILGAPVSYSRSRHDRPVAQLIARLCDVHPDGTSAQGELRRAEPHPSRRVRRALRAWRGGSAHLVRLQLSDCGAGFPAGHRLRLALSTAYWPMVWPAPETATVTILGGTIDLPMRPARA